MKTKNNDKENILSAYFFEKQDCKESDCKVNKKKIKKIFDPEAGLKTKKVQILRGVKKTSGNYKICDCIILCNNNIIYLIEILCGKLTSGELNDKIEQINNCKKMLKNIDLKEEKSYILYKNKDTKNINFKKVFLNPDLSKQKIFPTQIKNFTFSVC